MPLDGFIGFDLPVPASHLQIIMGAPDTLIGHQMDGSDFQFNKTSSGNGLIIFTGTHAATGVAFEVAFNCKGEVTGLTPSNSSAQVVVNTLSL